MIVKSDPLSTLIEGWETFEKKNKNKSALFADWRNAGLNRFRELGFPTLEDEEWKYTNVKPIANSRFVISTEQKILEKDALKDYCDPKEINLVFVNGVFNAEFSQIKTLPKGVTVLNLSEAAVSFEKEIAALSQKYSTEDAFVALNKALISDGAFVKVEAKVNIAPLIHIVHVTSTNEQIVTAPRTVILLGESAQAHILESHISFGQAVYFADCLTDVHLAENANLLYCKAQGESLQSFHIGTTRIWQERDSQLNSFSMTKGGMLTRNNLNIVLNGSGANSILNGLYAVADNQHVDNHTCVEHRPPNCTSNQLYKGILNGASRAVFNGKILVSREAQQTNSYQLNKNLLLGSNCRADTKPQLEIFADDVKCTHGATIGQLNEDEIFYLETRCIPRDIAVKMLARGFVDDILNRIEHASIVAKINKLLGTSFTEYK